MTAGTGYDIAIVGMACRVPGARTVEQFWQNLRSGTESITAQSIEALQAAGVSETLLSNPAYVPVAGPLEGMEDFDAGFFGFNPREGAILDPQHRHFLECAWEALEHAGHRPDRMSGPVGVFGGSGHNAYLPFNLLTNPELLDSVGMFLLRHTGNDKDFLTTRVSHLLDLRGPSIGVQTACSTSLVAVHLACQSLIAGECDFALAGAVTIELPHGQGYLYQEGEILSPDGHCRPFDAEAGGTVFGSGVGIVVLRRLTEALRDGDRVWAVIRGSAVNNDGLLKAGYLAPSVDGQAQAIAEAIAVADVPVETIGFVEGHGTGTPIGDPIEVAALTQAFGGRTSLPPWCALGSVKSNIGHLDTAAGVIGLIKAVLALVHREIPPTLHFRSPNPACGMEGSPFYVNSALVPWPAGRSPRRAGITSLGVGGTNAHVILEEAPAAVRTASCIPFQPLLLSARSPEALGRMAERLAGAFERSDPPDLADAAFTLAGGRLAMPYRRALVVQNGSEAPARLRAVAGQSGASRVPERPLQIGFLFPGGGAQHPGMAAEALATEPRFREVVEESLVALPRLEAEAVRAALSAEPGDAAAAALLERPALGLPALFAVQVGLAALWQDWGVRPSAVIGHSVGEYAAACVAGVLSLSDAARLVRFRGELFERLPAGAMLSVALDAGPLSERLEPGVSVAAANGPGLSVASGPTGAIARLERALAEEGVETSRLRIATAAHSVMLDPLLPEFRQFVGRLSWSPPQIPIASNLSGTWLSSGEAQDPDYWVRHLRHTVRFADGLALLLDATDRAVLEVGPGRTLASLARVHPDCGASRLVLTSLPHVQDARGAREHLLRTACTLWENGMPVDGTALLGPGRRWRIPLPTYPFKRERHWIAPGRGHAASGPVAPAVSVEVPALNRLRWVREQGGTGRIPGRVLLIDQGDGLAETVARTLAEAGAVVVRWSAPVSRDDRPTLPAELLGGTVPDVVVDCRVPQGGSPAEQAAWTLEQGLPTLTAIARHLAESTPPDAAIELAVVTRDLEDVAGDARGPAAHAVLAGAMPVIEAEFPQLVARVLDIGAADQPSWALEREVAHLIREFGRPERRVALRDGARWVPTFERADVPGDCPERRSAESAGTFLITGGTGALGLALAEWLGRQEGTRLALVSRRALPPREEWPAAMRGDDRQASVLRAISRLEDRGTEVLLLSADLSCPEQVEAAVRAARLRFGRLTGVVHAAGVLRDRLLLEKSSEEMRRVIAPKLVGALALDASLADDPPDWVAYFSSVSAVAGLPGQLDYAGANAALDALAARRQRQRRGRTVSIGWCAWTDRGMTAARSRYAGIRREWSLSAERDWVLADHRLTTGESVLPGTGFLNLAASAVGLTEEGLELHDVVIHAPVVVSPGASCTLAIAVDADGGLRITPAGTDGEELVTARVADLPPATPEPLDLALIQGRLGSEAGQASTAEASGAIRFGPRWRIVQSVRYGADEALLDLEAVGTGPDSPPLHAALFDMATAGAQALIPGWSDRPALYAPVSYGRVRLYRRASGRVVSHVRYRGDGESDGALALFDVTLADPSGAVLADVQSLALLRIQDPELLRHPHQAPHVPRRAASPPGTVQGLTVEEGVTAFQRVLAATGCAHVLVTPGDPTTYLSSLKSPPPRATAGEPDVVPLRQVLARLPELRDSVVTARWGRNGQPVIAAYLVLRPEAAATVSELRRRLKESLPEGPLPQVIVELDRLPRDADGAVILSELPDPLGEAEQGVEGPRTAAEHMIAQAWQELLGVERVGIRDNFFDIGGHSLLSIRLITRLYHLTQVRLRHEDVVVNTLEQLAAKLDAGGQTAA